MDIKEFIGHFRNHPVMFIGTGLSLRYFKTSYAWDDLLKKIAYDFTDSKEYYLDLKSDAMQDGSCQYEKVASQLEKDFDDYLKKNRNGKFESVNDMFYKQMEKGKRIDRFKLYIASLVKNSELKEGMAQEIGELKKARKNIGSVITTNYDQLVEQLFEFDPLIGNDILLSNPYGSVYKIHGCVTQPDKIIITAEDYKHFDEKYELIRAQLLSIFIHNPIIFIGYNIGDRNIKSILKTIFTYVEPNSDQAQDIRDNFLLIEYEKGSQNHEVYEHDIDMEGFPTIRINKLKTDDFISVYQSLATLQLPISAMDIRKVQTVVRDIYAGGNIKVSIASDLDALSNGDKVLVIGSTKNVRYEFQTISEMMANYFKIIDESNDGLLKLINKQKIGTSQYFPVFGFETVFNGIRNVEKLKKQQVKKLQDAVKNVHSGCSGDHHTFKDVESDKKIAASYKVQAIIKSVLNQNFDLDDLKKHLISYPNKRSTDYRKLLCAYDYGYFHKK